MENQIAESKLKEARRYGEFAEFVGNALRYKQIADDPAARRAVKQVRAYFEVAAEDVLLGQDHGNLPEIDDMALETIVDALKETCYLNKALDFLNHATRHVSFGNSVSRIMGLVSNAQIKIAPDNSDGYLYRGIAKSFLGEADVLKDIDKAIELNPKNSVAYSFRCGFKPSLEDAEKLLELLPKDHPDHYLGYCARGCAKIELGRFEEAITDFDKAEAVAILDKTVDFDYMIYYSRGYAKTQLGRFEEALKDYERAAELGKTNHHLLGFVKIKLGREDEALEHFNKQIEAEPLPYSYSWRAAILEKMGQIKDARKDYRTALDGLKKIPKENLHKNIILHLVRSTRGLLRIGTKKDKTGLEEKLKQYEALATVNGVMEEDLRNI